MAVAATTDLEPPKKKGPSLVVQLAVLLAMTGIAIGGGWFAGDYIRSEPTAEAAAGDHAAPAAAGHGEAAAGHGEEAPAAGHPMIIPLAPITTNLAQPADVWARIELAAVFDKAPDDPGLADSIHQDLLAYIRTLKLHQIEGASGFQHLRADFDERASIRSDGIVKRILIRTLLLE